jgi:hypothetical protein
MMTDDQKRSDDAKACGPGIGFLLAGIFFIVMICLGYTIIPYGRYGAQRPMEPWQMWGVGILLIAISIGGTIRQMKRAGRSMVNTTTLKNTETADWDRDASCEAPLPYHRTYGSRIRRLGW